MVNDVPKQQMITLHLNRTAIITAVIWTVVVILGIGWHFFEGYQNAFKSAQIQASHSFEKDLVYRRWAAVHGGVYVPVTATTLPNPYLSHIKTVM